VHYRRTGVELGRASNGFTSAETLPDNLSRFAVDTARRFHCRDAHCAAGIG